MTTSGGHDHGNVIAGVREQFREVLESSPQGIYIYLDDQHKLCNARFATLLGYESPDAWDRPGNFTEQYVDTGSHMTLVSAYRSAMEEKVASSVTVAWKTQGGTSVSTNVILVPIAYEGDLLALHFVTPS